MKRTRIVIVVWAAVLGAWALSAGCAGRGGAPAATEIRAAFRGGGVPVSPDDPTWRQVPRYVARLEPQIVAVPRGGGSVTGVTVQALHDGRQIALRFEWEDATADREVGVDRFRDAVAVGFPVREAETDPSPFMGDPEHPVDIWQWTADFDANAQGQGAFGGEYPHTEGVWYFPQDHAVTREVTDWRGFEPVMELRATGFGTLARKASQGVLGLARHDHGRWSVVLRRELSTGNPEDTMFRPGAASKAILAVWDGAQGEVNGIKGVTMSWVPLVLDATVVAGLPPGE